MKTFKKYASIENSYQKKYIEKILMEVPSDTQWVVTEKIHGANFSLHTDGKTLKAAKRSSYIGSGDDFFNARPVIQKYSPAIKQLYNYLVMKKLIDTGDVISFYGEYYGGKYLHPEVDKDKTASTVQKEVQYCPHNDFMIFDVAINGEYVDWDVFLTIKNHNARIAADMEDLMLVFPEQSQYIPLKFIDELAVYNSLQEALEHNHEFITSIPGYYALPPIEDNTAEGIVIKPWKNHYIYNNDRVLIKKKTQKFSEKQSVPKEPSLPIGERYPQLIPFLTNISTYVNMNRINAVLSKEGKTFDDVEGKEIGKFLGLFTKDCIEDYLKDHSDFYNLPKDEQRIITKEIAACASKYFKKEKFGYE